MSECHGLVCLPACSWVDKGGLTGKEFIPAGPPGSYDSYVCFAAHSPVVGPDGKVWLYYMGGNGPHSGYRCVHGRARERERERTKLPWPS